MAGFYPGDELKRTAERKIGSLLEVGVRTLINLMEDGETNRRGVVFKGYETVAAAEARARGLTVRCERFPIRDLHVPGRDLMKRIIGVIDASISAGEPVYAHCRGGRGRTGTVMCCWLLEKGLATPENVFRELNRLRESVRNGGPSPETRIQLEYVRGWMKNGR